MNDIFKVRVWNVSGGYYLPEFYLTPSGEVCEFGVFNGTPQVRKFDNQENYRKERCTGLTDRNGKLIFAGDFVKVVGGGMFEHGMTFEVVDGISRWQIRNCGNYKHYNKYHDLDIGSMFEIIGNIHEMEVPQ